MADSERCQLFCLCWKSPNENAFCCGAAGTSLTRTLTRRAALSAATRVSTLSGRRTPVTPRWRARADTDREAGRAHRDAVRVGRARSRHPNFCPAHRGHRAPMAYPSACGSRNRPTTPARGRACAALTGGSERPPSCPGAPMAADGPCCRRKVREFSERTTRSDCRARQRMFAHDVPPHCERAKKQHSDRCGAYRHRHVTTRTANKRLSARLAC